MGSTVLVRVCTFCRRYSLLVIFFWVALAVAGNVFVPQIETVAKENSRAFLPTDSTSVQAARDMGAKFDESTSNNLAYIIVESDQRLADRDLAYLSAAVDRLRMSPEFVDSVIDLAGDPLSARFARSSDGKAAFSMLRLSGDIGTATANTAVERATDVVADEPAPPGLRVYITGPGPTVADELGAIDRQMWPIIISSAIIIAILIYFVYRSLVTSRVPLITVGLALAVARPAVALMGETGVASISIFSANLMSSILLGAVANYGMFLLGRYQEERRKQVPWDEALTTSYRRTAPVVLASALTVAIALSCLSLAKIDLLKSAGIPCAVGLLVGSIAGLTLNPAMIALLGRRGMLDPRPLRTSRGAKRRRWHRAAVVVARWPRPVAVAGIALLAVLATPLLWATVSYDESAAVPSTSASSLGYEVAARHFPPNRLLPAIVSISSDTDLYTPSGMIAVNSLTRKIADLPGVNLVQSVTQPAGTPLDESTLAYQAGVVGNRIGSATSGTDDIQGRLGQVRTSLGSISGDLGSVSQDVQNAAGSIQQILPALDRVRSLITTIRPLTERLGPLLGPAQAQIDSTPNCAGVPACSDLKSGVDALSQVVGSVDTLSTTLDGLSDAGASVEGIAQRVPQLVDKLSTALTASTGTLDEIDAKAGALKTGAQTIRDYLAGIDAAFRGTGQGGFYMPPEVLTNPDFRAASKNFVSPDRKATRLFVYGDGNAFGADGIALAGLLDGTVEKPLRDAGVVVERVDLVGVGPTMRDIKHLTSRDTLVLAICCLVLVFAIVAYAVRSLVAGSVVVVGVVCAYLATMGLSVLLWQVLLEKPLHWMVVPISFIALVAVGSDYNLLLCARLREEIPLRGFGGGMIAALSEGGKTVAAAGVVFGATMFALVRSDVLSVAQVGTTVGLGLLVDTFLVRSFVVPAIARMLHRWFWWPAFYFDRARLGGKG